jgi:hypothetical protein
VERVRKARSATATARPRALAPAPPRPTPPRPGPQEPEAKATYWATHGDKASINSRNGGAHFEVRARALRRGHRLAAER